MTDRPEDPGDERHRSVGEGVVMGAAALDHVLVWYGLPYAAPPVGEHRWRAPRPPQPWEGVRDATRRPPPAKQTLTFSTPRDGGEGATIGDEDCLYLTVWSPRRGAGPSPEPERGLPVVVWFHGGGNLVGDGAEFNAAPLAASQQVVVVSINHRLNLLGWFAHKALRDLDAEGGPAGRSGNFAVLDHIRALEWIRTNIAAFGGDPSCVTVMGHSGGGWNVRALLCSPLAEGLFHRAIIQSVSAFQLMTPQHAESFVGDEEAGHPLSSNELILSLWLADGRAPDEASARAQITATPDAEMAAYLRGQPYEALARALVATRKRNAAIGSREALTVHSSRRLPQMFADGVVTDQIVSRVPILVGTTRYEDRAFLASNPRYVANLYGHPVIRDRARYQLASEYLGKLYKVHGVDDLARHWRGQGLQVYAYRCDWDELASPPWLDFSAPIGACHGSELPLIFGSADLGREYAFQRHLYDETDGSAFRRMSAIVMSYWTAFARDGAPRGGRDGGLPDWRGWGDGEYLILATPAGGGVRMSDETLTEATVVEQIRSDPRVPIGPARRRIIEDLRGHPITRLSEASYEALDR